MNSRPASPSPEPFLLHHPLLRSVERAPDKLALVHGPARHSYADVLNHACAVAECLREAGVARGDRVALYLDNGIEFVAGLYGSLLIGAVAMPINPLAPADKLARLLDGTAAAALLTQQTLADRWRSAAAVSPTLKAILVTGAQSTCDLPQVQTWPPSDARQRIAPSRESPAIDRDLAVIMHTSGSTGVPKGVMLSHLNMLSAARSVSSYLGLHADDVIHCALPLSFNYGLYQVLMAFGIGATVVLERGFAFPVKSLELMAREGCTVFPGVPTMFSMLTGLRNAANVDLPRLRLMSNAAAALSQEHIRRLRALFPQAALYSMYGLTECTRVSFLPPEQLDIRPASVGRGMPNEEVWLVDDEGRRLPWGATGELVIRGSHVMLGYWASPELTAQRLRPGPLSGETVLHSGDLFRTDDEGWLYFVSRRDDIIKSRGEKISPVEVENAIYSLEGVHEVAVVGVDDALLGQAVKAYVVPTEDATLSERQIIRHCQARLETYMVPKSVEFVSQFSKTHTGKILKAGLGGQPARETTT